MKGDKMEEEVDQLIKVSQSLEVVNFTVSTSGDIFLILSFNNQFANKKYPPHFSVEVNLEKTNESLTVMEENLLGRNAALTATEEELNKVNI